MNSVHIIGRVTKDLELRKTASGTSVIQFTLAVPRNKEEADFINFVAYGKTADNMSRYVHKGSQIAVEGRIQTRNYEGKNGRVYVTEVVCNNVQFLDPRSDATSQNTYGQANTYGTQQKSAMDPKHDYMQGDTLDINDSDLPF